MTETDEEGIYITSDVWCLMSYVYYVAFLALRIYSYWNEYNKKKHVK